MAITSCKRVRLAGVGLFWEKSTAGWFVLISQANMVTALSILLAIELQAGIQLKYWTDSNKFSRDLKFTP
jgi:hypothetical protein